MAARELFYTSLFLDDCLQGYWRFDGSSVDWSTQGNNGSDTDMTYGVAHGKFGQGASFNGSSSYVSLGASKFNFSTGTIMFWLVAKPSDSSCHIWSRCPDADVWPDFGITVLSGTLKFSSDRTICNLADLSDGDHIAFTLNGTTAQLYKNGSLVSEITSIRSLNGQNMGNGLSIGRAGEGNRYYFDGKLDDLCIFNRILTSDEISAYYNGTLPTLWQFAGPPRARLLRRGVSCKVYSREE
jgi:hypothetical protein